MRSSDHYETAVVRVSLQASACEVAARMERNAVGAVVVTDATGRLAGILTDRDLLRRVVAAGRDGEKTRARDVMTPDPVCGTPDQPLEEIVAAMRDKGVRRLPIVRDGAAVGIVTLDDILAALSEELGDVGEAVRGEVLGARRTARMRHRRDRLETAVEEVGAQIAQIGSQTLGWLRKAIDSRRHHGDDKDS